MNKIIVKTLFGISVLGFSLAAGATDVNWGGAYVGANAGYGWGKSDVSTTTVFSPIGYFANTSPGAIGNASSGSIKSSTWAGGITGGYNAQVGNTVFGVEADLDAMHLSKSRTNSAAYPCCTTTSFTNTQSVDADWLVTVRGRVGYAMDHSLFYATGGLAVTSIESKNHFTDNFAAVDESSSQKKTKYGWALGLGYEHALENKWSIKADYLHADFGHVSSTSNNLTASSSIPYPMNTFTNQANLTMDMIRVGVNKRW